MHNAIKLVEDKINEAKTALIVTTEQLNMETVRKQCLNNEISALIDIRDILGSYVVTPPTPGQWSTSFAPPPPDEVEAVCKSIHPEWDSLTADQQYNAREHAKKHFYAWAIVFRKRHDAKEE